MNKYFIWGFPGIGKSTVNSPLRIVDADCKRFKFITPEDTSGTLHSQQNTAFTQRNLVYPNNYWEYIYSVEADVVFLNCHINLLENLDKEKLLLVYPSATLKEEYLRRYALRGDNSTYIHYMETAFDEIIATIQNSPYRKFEISGPNIYLHNIIEKGTIMEQFITKNELSVLLSECVQTGVYIPEGTAVGKTSDELAQMLFDGSLSLDVAKLKNDLVDKRAALEQERILHERRGGLSHEELSSKIMEGIVNGALSIWHTEVAPYSMGYEVTFRPAENRVTYSWACYCSFFDVAEQITQKIENAMPQVDVSTLLAGIAWAEQNKITSFVLETDSGLQPRGYYTGHVANVRDVHQGIALDGIILGHFQGDYSSMTTGTQNDIVRALVALKGFCLDCIHRLPSRPLIKFAIAYLKDHGTDISTPEKLNVWIKENPDKCALPENRVRTPSRLTTGQTALNRGKKQRKNEHER